MLPVVTLIVASLQVLAILSGVLLVLTSPAARRSFAAIRNSMGTSGGASLVATLFVMGLLALQLISAAIEKRLFVSSPFGSLPIVGRLVSVLLRRQRVSFVLIGVAVTTLMWALLARLPRVRPIAPRGHRRTFALILGWLVVCVASTWLAGAQLTGDVIAPYAAAVLSLVAVLVSVPLIDRVIALRLLVATLVAATAATYGAMLLSHDWAWTAAWPGGFRSGDRLQGIFPQPNVAGIFYGLGVLVVLGRHDIRPIARALLASPMVVLVYWSGSRGAVLLLIAGGLAVTWARGSRRRLSGLALACATATIVLPAFNLNARSGALAGRAETWRMAYAIGRQSPFVGAGDFPLRPPFRSSEAIYAHNQLLQTFTEAGVIGTLLLAAAVWAAVRSQDLRFATSSGALIGLMATFPFESPVRLFAPPFSAPLVIVLVLVGSGRAAVGSVVPTQAPIAANERLRG